MPRTLPGRLPGKSGASCSTKPGVKMSRIVISAPTMSFSVSLIPPSSLNNQVRSRLGLTGEDHPAGLVGRVQPVFDLHRHGAFEKSDRAGAARPDPARVVDIDTDRFRRFEHRLVRQ